MTTLRVLLSVAIIAGITLLDYRLIHVNSTTVALTFLLAVLGIATRWGLVESMAASLAGMLSFNFFFLPPVGTWTIAEPQNWVAFFAFVVTAAVASHLSASAKRRAVEATSRQHEMERLYDLSRALMLMDASMPPAEQIAGHIGKVFGFPCVVFYDREAHVTYRIGEDFLPESALTVWPVQLGAKVMGSLRLPPTSASSTALRAIAQLAAVALERARGQQAASRAEAIRQSEELKSAMLDALAHEFKTPLTSIRAAVTSMVDDPAGPAQKELLQIVDEETDRLASMVTEAIHIARIEAGEIELRRTPQSITDLIRESLAKLAHRLESRPLELRLGEDLPPVAADPELVRIVIRQLVDNAAKYSPPDSPISIRAAHEQDAVVVVVGDRGPGISEADRARVFEKFYRGRDAQGRIPGTGMGLAIARDIIRAHNGDMEVHSRPGEGTEFLFRLPLARQEQRA